MADKPPQASHAKCGAAGQLWRRVFEALKSRKSTGSKHEPQILHEIEVVVFKLENCICRRVGHLDLIRIAAAGVCLMEIVRGDKNLFPLFVGVVARHFQRRFNRYYDEGVGRERMAGRQEARVVSNPVDRSHDFIKRAEGKG